MHPARFYRNTKGAVALETAIVLPLVLVPLLLGIYDFGSLMIMSMEVEHATQAAASYAYDRYVETGTVPSIATIQTTVETQSLPVTITISQDTSRSSSWPWSGCPTGTAVQPAGTCTAGLGTFISIIGSAPTNTPLGTWVGFPATVSAKILVRLK